MNAPTARPTAPGADTRPPARSQAAPRGPSSRLSSVRDTVGKALIVLFLVKPTIDLLWRFGVSFGGINLSPTTVSGLIICLLFGGYWLSRPQYAPPFARAMEAFLALNVVSFVFGLFSPESSKLAEVLNVGIRIVASYFIYSAAFAAAVRNQYQDFTPFFKAIMVGAAIAVVFNVVGIQLGFGGTKWGDYIGDARERGLYFDAGVLANAALYSLMFAVFLIYAVRGQALWVLFCLLIIVFDLYLISLTKSRAAIIQVAMFGLIFAWMFHRSWGRIVAPVAAVLLMMATIFVFGVDMDETFERFQTDMAVLEQQGDSGVGTTGQGEVSLGKFEKLGNRRGALWADALTRIAQRPLHELLFGNFSGSLAHSDYIDVIGRNGVLGGLLYIGIMLGLLFKTFSLARQNHRDPSAKLIYCSAFAVLCCYLLYSIPFRPLLYTTTSWYLWVLLGFAMARERLSRMPRAPAKPAAATAAPPETEAPVPRRDGPASPGGRPALRPPAPRRN